MFNIKICGSAGSGVLTTGNLISEFFAFYNKEIVLVTQLPSRITGGINIVKLEISNEKLNSISKKEDLLMILDNVDEKINFKNLYNSKYDNKSYVFSKLDYIKTQEKLNSNFKRENINLIDEIFFETEIEKIKEKYRLKHSNIIYFGYLLGFLKIDKNLVLDFISYKQEEQNKYKFDNFKEVIISSFDFAGRINLENNFNFSLISKDFTKNKDNKFLSGNQVSALASIKAGVKFVCGYPITPGTSILEFIEKNKDEFDIEFIQTEDEISAINMLLGSSISSVRGLTSTSGAGLSLMSEAIGMSGISETGIVVFSSQRAGPSTGVPTFTAQEDLKQAINISQGEFPIIVFTPADLEEIFKISFEAQNIAQIYQVPVIILLDAYLSFSKFTVNVKKIINENKSVFTRIDDGKVNKDYKEVFRKRYEITKSGISKKGFPQTNSRFIVSNHEHDEYSFTSKNPEIKVEQNSKRFRKISTFLNDYKDVDFVKPKVYGSLDFEKVDLTLVGWGSTKGAILDAIKNFENVNYLHFSCCYPFFDETKKVLKKAKNLAILEANSTGQLRDIISEKTQIKILEKRSYLKCDLRSFEKEEVVKFIEKTLEDIYKND